MKKIGFFLVTAALTALLPSSSFAVFLGPYSGTVIDNQTGEPVEGASVLFYFLKHVPTIPLVSYSEVFHAKLVYTNKRGFYEIPQAVPNLGLVGRIERTSIVIYQPGYQAYIENVWHDAGGSKPVTALKERGNIVKLDRIPPKFDYGKHFRKIQEALDLLRYPDLEDPISGRLLSWEKRKEKCLRSGVVEKEEFLRRVEWEENR